VIWAAFASILHDSQTRPARSTRAELDLALLERHLAGDRDAFAAIYRDHVAAVYRRLSRILGPVPEREDLVQEVFIALHRALPGFRGEAALATLIHRIAINRACEYLRRQARRPVMLVEAAYFDDLRAPGRAPDLLHADRQHLTLVFECLARIKPKKRVAFLLRVVEGLSFEEIGALVDATPETVAKRVQYAQRELDARLARAEERRA
jgi:RNA polymerase sigma-70 factor, ECF subfamily